MQPRQATACSSPQAWQPVARLWGSNEHCTAGAAARLRGQQRVLRCTGSSKAAGKQRALRCWGCSKAARAATVCYIAGESARLRSSNAGLHKATTSSLHKVLLSENVAHDGGCET
ncbi:hypothetical protein Acr_05g0012480 [Actinidia rufa]|uniref:Uncharacterized protein n=1 Tax=Actinidia rufa TaxID=165716 RepID=A0A7J0ENQ3_9ERIC|nr:hypothetical protein Acr_05g0012480 [Actinidia rufa]